jgi:undecaprenyl diphosphate synthase
MSAARPALESTGKTQTFPCHRARKLASRAAKTKSPRKLHRFDDRVGVTFANGVENSQSTSSIARSHCMKAPALPSPRHVAIIMDGNGRWATARNLQRIDGHAEGAKAVRHAVETASRIGIEFLTLYAFSANNWARPSAEVEALMSLMVDFARSECAELRQNGIRVKVIGQTDSLPQYTKDAVDELVRATSDGQHMTLTLALSYGARQDVLLALRTLAARVQQGSIEPRDIDAPTLRAAMTTHYLPDVDLLIRTGGESRISDFLLLEAAYAELLFLPIMWPDFQPETLVQAIDHYRGIERRYGLTSEQLQSNDGRSALSLIRAASGL